jgi:hypothetical protein
MRGQAVAPAWNARAFDQGVAVRGTTRSTPTLAERWMAGTYARPGR